MLIPKVCYRSFKKKYTSFATVSCLTISTHLWKICGTLQKYEVQENDEMMKQQITSETIFKDFVEQIEFLLDAVVTQIPYTPQQIVSIVFTLVEKLGLYYDGNK